MTTPSNAARAEPTHFPPSTTAKDLSFSNMYFVDIEPATGDLAAFEIIPHQIRQFRLGRPSRQDIEWMQQTLQRECLQFETGIVLDPGGWPVPSHPMCNRPAT